MASLPACVDQEDEDGGFDESTLVEDVTIPPPTNLTATVVSCTRVNLAWNAVAGATKYIVLRGSAPGNEISYTTTRATPTTFTDGHLTAGRHLSYEVKAVIGTSISSISNEVLATTPACAVPGSPTGVTAVATSSSRITVTWTAVSGAAKYLVLQAQGAGPFSQVAAVVAPTVTYNAASLAAATTYNYEIEAVDAAGNISAPSTIASATTFALGLEGYWRYDEHGGALAKDSSGFARNGTLSGGETEAFALPKAPLDSNISYVSNTGAATAFVSVPNASAFNFTANAWSVAFWVRLPTAPTAIVRLIGMRTASCGSVGWEIAQDSTNHLHFRGQTVLSSGTDLVAGAWTHVAVTYSGTTMRIYVNGVQKTSGSISVGNHLALPVEFGNSGGCPQGGPNQIDEAQIFSRQLSDSEVAAIGKVPAAPTSLAVSVASASQENLTWTGVQNASKYIVLIGSAAGNEAFLTSVPATPTSFNDGHLTPSTQYSWQVEAVVGGLLSGPSNEVIKTTTAAPAAPTGVTATTLSSSRIKIAWTAVTGAAKYQVLQSVGGGPFTLRGTVLSPTVTFTDANLTTNTAYTYEVKALDSSNNASVASTPASATTL